MIPSLWLGVLVGTGMLAHLLAWRLRLPLVVLLLGLGALLERCLMMPQAELQAGLQPLLGGALALLYFEGGSTLAARPLGSNSHLLTHLAAIGPKVGWLLVAALAYFLLGISFLLALLCGALLLIGAPYTIEPMVERLGGTKEIADVLHWECFLISCIGVAWTVLVGKAVAVNGGHPNLVKTLEATAATAGAGVLIAYLMAFLLRRALPLVPSELRHPLAVAVAFLAFGLSQQLYQGAGLVAAITLGYLVSQAGESVPDTTSFWTSLRVLALGLLGVYLGMAIPPETLLHNWPRCLALALSLVFIVRPLLVWLAARKAHLTPRQRAILMLVAPKGAINLAVAALVAQQLTAAQHPEAGEVLPVVYWAFLVTTLLPWLLGPLMLRRYGPDPAPA